MQIAYDSHERMGIELFLGIFGQPKREIQSLRFYFYLDWWKMLKNLLIKVTYSRFVVKCSFCICLKILIC
ncbi:hypothetical protein COL22_02405 [Bacillus thuringiensis]|nr:hypothetical protein F8517_14975 [Bacillus thuringiensis]PFA86817.1 hypothetical protein CN400_09525 [Bacillus thuringiensis]PFB41484.1 hypothetical protein CN396_24885 [Bacillus thuringiensis]PFE94206.1 hypothetical protein CN321_09445 [Bacillus thuringiensis]PFV45041.1 hypothetical protein COL03_07115 [Bacillus thuringiensis]